MAKTDPFREGGKVERSNATPFKLFSVDSYDLKSISFKSSNNVFMIFEMSRSSFLMSVSKMNISCLFRPSASEVLEIVQHFYNRLQFFYEGAFIIYSNFYFMEYL